MSKIIKLRQLLYTFIKQYITKAKIINPAIIARIIIQIAIESFTSSPIKTLETVVISGLSPLWTNSDGLIILILPWVENFIMSFFPRYSKTKNR